MYPPLVFVVHRTAGHVNTDQLYWFFQDTCISAHFGISYDGHGDPNDIWQFVELWDGAGANCCPESGCHWFFGDRGGNANVYTISVEVCTPNTNNQGLMTGAQEDALVYLIQTVCNDLGIPTDNFSEYWNDTEDTHTWISGDGGIGMHRDVSPHNKIMCPGDPYYQGQMDRIIERVRGGHPGGSYMQGFGDAAPEMEQRMWECHYFDTAAMLHEDFSQIQVPRTNTGIHGKWLENLNNGKYHGGVCSEEYPFGEYMCQNFTGAQYRYHKPTGNIDWIDCT